MIKLRFVEEYRDRRIVTNGKLFGIEGELVTDCRYLNVTGARAAIDSELGVARRRKDLDEQRRHFAQFISEHGEGHRFGCECGWRGPYSALGKKGREEIVVRCPKCKSDYVFLAFDAARA